MNLKRIEEQLCLWRYYRYRPEIGVSSAEEKGPELTAPELWALYQKDPVLHFKMELHSRVYPILMHGSLGEAQALNALMGQFGDWTQVFQLMVEPRGPIFGSGGAVSDIWWA